MDPAAYCFVGFEADSRAYGFLLFLCVVAFGVCKVFAFRVSLSLWLCFRVWGSGFAWVLILRL